VIEELYKDYMKEDPYLIFWLRAYDLDVTKVIVALKSVNYSINISILCYDETIFEILRPYLNLTGSSLEKTK